MNRGKWSIGAVIVALLVSLFLAGCDDDHNRRGMHYDRGDRSVHHERHGGH